MGAIDDEAWDSYREMHKAARLVLCRPLSRREVQIPLACHAEVEAGHEASDATDALVERVVARAKRCIRELVDRG